MGKPLTSDQNEMSQATVEGWVDREPPSASHLTLKGALLDQVHHEERLHFSCVSACCLGLPGRRVAVDLEVQAEMPAQRIVLILLAGDSAATQLGKQQVDEVV